MKPYHLTIFIFALSLCGGCDKQVKETKPETKAMSFKSDEKIQRIAEAYSLDAIDVAQSNFKIKLDWTDSSIEQVEMMLDQLHKQVSESKPSQEQIQTFSKMFGSYIGEVYRKNYGGEWGLVEMNGATVPGIQNLKEEATFWPWIRVRNRINNGYEHNVWHYYQTLTTKK